MKNNEKSEQKKENKKMAKRACTFRDSDGNQLNRAEHPHLHHVTYGKVLMFIKTTVL